MGQFSNRSQKTLQFCFTKNVICVICDLCDLSDLCDLCDLCDLWPITEQMHGNMEYTLSEDIRFFFLPPLSSSWWFFFAWINAFDLIQGMQTLSREMCRSIQSFNTHPCVKFHRRFGQKLGSNDLPKSSDQALKSIPCRPFLLSRYSGKWTLPLNTSTLKDKTLVFQRRDPSDSNYPP